MNAHRLAQRIRCLRSASAGRAVHTSTSIFAAPSAKTSPSSTSSSSSSPSVAQTRKDNIDPSTIVLGQLAPSRLSSHAEHLAPDLLYLLYDPHFPDLPDPEDHLPVPDPSNPYAANRPAPRVRGGRQLRPKADAPAASNLPKLEKIVLHSYVRGASGNRAALVPVLAAFRSISGSTRSGGNNPGRTGVELVYAKHSVSQWKVRPGNPMGVKVAMRGEQMWTFLNTLVEFVIPRMRDFSGFPLPSAQSSPNMPNNMSGTVSVGFPPTAMGLFPQIEANFDQYPRMEGFHVQFVTDQKGKGAQDRARQFLSGFRIPFVRR